MDYHSLRGRDVSSFDLSSTHRLPTVSAAQAYDDLDDDAARYVPTGLEALDGLLAAGTQAENARNRGAGGCQRGQVTEIWGPPGVGKTAFGIQLTANAMRRGGCAVWVDAFHPMPCGRLAASIESQLETASADLGNLTHFTCPSLPHFIALLCRSSPQCIPPSASLVVIDSLSALINHAFPRTPESRAGGKGGGKAPPAPARRHQVLQHIITALQKIAAARDTAVVILSQCATRLQADRGATLIPAINAGAWEQGISSRLVLFRDWIWEDGQHPSARFASLQKLNGKATQSPVEHAVAFDITSDGVVALDYQASQGSLPLASTPAIKRKLDDAEFEVPDSDDEDYGWHDGVDTMPDMPPQTQGSEDLLIGHHQESDDVEEDEDEHQGHDDSSSESTES